MKTIRKVEIKIEWVQQMPDKKDMIQGVVYISEEYGVSIHKCLCGDCAELTVMPINHDHITTGWDLIKNEEKISFVPSIGNFQFPCKSHYIITNNIANFV